MERTLARQTYDIQKQTGGTCFAHAATRTILHAWRRVPCAQTPSYQTLLNAITNEFGSNGGNPRLVVERFGRPADVATDIAARFGPDFTDLPPLRITTVQVEELPDLIASAAMPNAACKRVLCTFRLSTERWNSFVSFFERTPQGVLDHADLEPSPDIVEELWDDAISHAVVVDLEQSTPERIAIKNSWGTGFATDGCFFVASAGVLMPQPAHPMVLFYLEWDEKDVGASLRQRQDEALRATSPGAPLRQIPTWECLVAGDFVSPLTGSATPLKSCQYDGHPAVAKIVKAGVDRDLKFALAHRNIVEVHGWRAVDSSDVATMSADQQPCQGTPVYLVMEAGEGTLADYVAATPPSLRRSACLLAAVVAVANAMTYLAQQGIVHRDVKPENVVTFGSVWKLIDFGISSHASNPTVRPRGTPDWTDPALLMQTPQDGVLVPARDVYSLGKLLEYVVVYLLPIADDPHRHLLQAIAHQCQDPDVDKRPLPLAVAEKVDEAERWYDSLDRMSRDSLHSKPAAAHTLRPYQERIVKEVLERPAENCIIVLPTGAGKTHAAAEIVRARLSPGGKLTVFFVPTVLLVEQQAAVLRSWIPAHHPDGRPVCIAEMHGPKALPSAFDILVCTPDSFLARQQSGGVPRDWNAYGMLVFDEVHHLLKDHPYNVIVRAMRGDSALLPPSVRILGLTATLSYKVDEKEMTKSIDKLCAMIGVTHVATARASELEASGYHAKAATAHVQLPDVDTRGCLPRDQRLPHLMLPLFLKRCEQRAATPAALRLHDLAAALEAHAATLLPGFAAPNRKPSNGRREVAYLGVSEWSAAAWKVVERHRHKHVALAATVMLLMHVYEALRIAVVSWEEQAGEGSLMYLRMYELPQSIADYGTLPPALADQVRRLFDAPDIVAAGYPRLEHLASILESRYCASFHGVLFCEQRVMVHVLTWYITAHEPRLRGRFRVAKVHADTPATPLLRLTKAESQKQLELFRSKEANLLVATNAAEEGMDVPSANIVLRFDPMHTAVSLVQGRGRARDADSAFVVLSERHDRPTAELEEAERRQEELLQRRFGAVAGGGGGGARDRASPALAVTAVAAAGAPLAAAQMQERFAAESAVAQRSRVMTAVQGLRVQLTQQRLPAANCVHTFCQKAKLDLQAEECSVGTIHEPQFRFSATLRCAAAFGEMTGTATAPAKKEAKELACGQLAAQLCRLS